MSSQSLHYALLRPAIIHMLRAAGFHSTRPSVLDTLTDLCVRYLMLLASRTAKFAYERTSLSYTSSGDGSVRTDFTSLPTDHLMSTSHLDHITPTISDVRLALASASSFASSLTSTEEAWREALRKPLVTLPAAAQEKERRRRDAEDTKDVREFIEWVTGSVNRDIRRIAGLYIDESSSGGVGAAGPSASGGLLNELSAIEKEDYLTVLKKKHSKTGEGARYAGTAVGKEGENRGVIRIEGGPIATIAEFNTRKRHSEEGHENGRSDARRMAAV